MKYTHLVPHRTRSEQADAAVLKQFDLLEADGIDVTAALAAFQEYQQQMRVFLERITSTTAVNTRDIHAVNHLRIRAEESFGNATREVNKLKDSGEFITGLLDAIGESKRATSNLLQHIDRGA